MFVAKLFIFFLFPAALFAEPIRIIHINDLQSRFENAAIVASIIKSKVAEVQGRALVLDAGDFLAGSLIQHLATRKAYELRYMNKMGIQYSTLGNHEFDFGLNSVKSMVQKARQDEAKPVLVQSNLIFPSDFDWTDFADQKFALTEVGGVKIGLMGVLGRHAKAVSPALSEVVRLEPEEALPQYIQQIQKSGHDFIVLMSHSGILPDGSTYRGEDADIALALPELDLIISGHSHIATPSPFNVGDTMIVQAGANGQYVGVLDIEVNGQQKFITNYELIAVDNWKERESDFGTLESNAQADVNSTVLKPLQSEADDIIAHLPESMDRDQVGRNFAETLHVALEAKLGEAIDTVVLAKGLVRDSLKKGPVSLAQLFYAYPLGGQKNGEIIGYPLMSMYLDETSFLNLLEISATIGDLLLPSYSLFLSRVQISTHDWRLPFNRVSEYSGLEDSPINGLRHVVVNRYLWDMLPLVADRTFGLLNFEIFDRNGVKNPSPEQLYLGKNADGNGYLSEWPVLVEYLKTNHGFASYAKGPTLTKQAGFFSKQLWKSWGMITYISVAFGLIAVLCIAKLGLYFKRLITKNGE